MGNAPYRRGYKHTIERGQSQRIVCNFCGKATPRHKSIVIFRGFRINDPQLLKTGGIRQIQSPSTKMYVCPSCAKRRHIVKKSY